MKIRRWITAVLGILLHTSAGISVSAQYRFSSWTVDNGLPQNTIYDIQQTRDGYLWLTTLDGLVRFDGVRFTVFTKGNTPGISSNRFLRLYEDVDGDLWAGTEDGGLIRYHQDGFTSYGKEQGLKALNTYYVTGDPDGHVVVYVAGGQVLRFLDGKLQAFSPPNGSVRDPGSVAQSRRVACPRIAEGIICVGYRSEGWNKSDGLPSLNRAGGDGIDDGRGALWIATDGGLVKIEQDKVVRVFTQRDGFPGNPILFVTGARVSVLSRDEHGSFWLTDVHTMASQMLGNNVPASVVDSGVSGYEDREGNIWFGTTRNGLHRARKQFITGYSIADGLTQNNVNPILEDRNGVVWMGTTKGLFRYHDQTFAPDETVNTGNVTAIAEDLSGRMVVAVFGQLWIREGGRFRKILEQPNGVIWSIYPDRDGTLWLGWDSGLIHLKDGVETVYTTKDGLAGNDVKVMIDDGSGGFWIGAYGGLSRFSNGRFTTWTEREGLPSRTVRALYRDRDGVVWIGTYDGGLARFKDGKFARYTSSEGLSNNGAFQILEDGRGYFWMSSNRGIYRVLRKELEELADGQRSSITSVSYGKSDGMLNIECNGGRWPAGVRTRDGKLWFPTQDGVAVIDPDAVPVNPQPPPVMIESFLLDRAPVALDGEVRIQPNQENFEIQYTALSYISSDDLRFKYKLEGLDREWVDAGTRRTAYYSHVRPGNYTFKVIAANRDGVWNLQGASIRLSVLPRFDQTWWFPTLIALGIFSLGIAGYRVRVKRLERAHKTQEDFSHKLLQSQEFERQRIAAELHDSLGQSLLIIKNRIALAQRDIDEPETVSEQLGELSQSATSAIEECREIAYNLRPFQLERFGLSKTLSGMFMRLSEVSKIHATVEIEAIDDSLTHEQQVNVFRIVQECVNNIIRHSQATEARLIVKRKQQEITLLVEDNGRGFQREPAPGGPSTTGGDRGPAGQAAAAGRSQNDRSGFGLIGIAERVKMLHGSYEIESDRGTSIRIKIPCQ
jgi:signal transduction histidine kinase/ligand-binding sensor domain-containing protein